MMNDPLPIRTLGVIGGMGSLATVDFLNKLVHTTPATCDQEHIPMVVHFCPQMPDRCNALRGCGPSPKDQLIQAALGIERSGAQGLVMVCNTAHAWYDDITQAVRIPVIHIADAAVASIPATPNQRIGLLATSGTLMSQIYPKRHPHLTWLTCPQDVTQRWVMPGIAAVKSGQIELGTQLLSLAAQHLIDQGCTALILGCTEIPVALQGVDFSVPVIDATQALAQTCVHWALHRQYDKA